MENLSNPFGDSDFVDRIGPLSERSDEYKTWLLSILRSNNCRRILDVACGTGVDSVYLLKQGMEVVSCDDSEAMLRYARREKERLRLDDWDIKRANWLTLTEDLTDTEPFDAVLCLGSSILHLVDSTPELVLLRKCLVNFKKILKPGGLLMIDHRNLDAMLDRGLVVNKRIYHKEHALMEATAEVIKQNGSRQRVDISYSIATNGSREGNLKLEKKTLQLAPVYLHDFSTLLKEVFGTSRKYAIYGDLVRQDVTDTENTAYFQHVIYKGI
ncbi:glycine N-methyltransferase-like isoform X2 [Lytechinus variegatus]|uniref:glycine N-methyltransferase-like isoform X1 n=1 Tax=Lytechinus variegatus TaxID=7654 RepID=UPI001BB18BDB|nr:glycine N-methyltransferase-like isoform X1 [Lytechinus variegatus]XP_041466680.1 glycine N-methyltransferase-like isoform X2 [Lytechinus variegatus]